MAGRRAPLDTDIVRRRAAILQEMCAHEAPRVLLLFVVIIVLFDAGFAAIGVIATVDYYLSDVIQASANVIVAVLILRGVIPPRWAPTAFVLAIMVDNAALNYQYWISGAGSSAAGVTLLTMTVYGAVTLRWWPFLLSAVWMGALTTFTYVTVDPEGGPYWSLTAITALVVSGTVLYGRTLAVIPLAQANRTIETLATHDALTGVMNRHGMELATPVVVSFSERSGQPMFSVFIDVVGLKATNDAHGHTAGDLVIQRTAAALKTQIRDSDLLCRWGGDEFVLVGLGDPPDPADFTARTVASLDTAGLEGIWTPSISVGVSTATDGDVAALIGFSDAHMYERRRMERS